MFKVTKLIVWEENLLEDNKNGLNLIKFYQVPKRDSVSIRERYLYKPKT